MSANVFHRQNVRIDNSLVCSLEKRSLRDIFQFGQQAYICVGTSKSGKTTIVKDLFSIYAKEYTQAYYITSTDMDISNENLGIPPSAIRKVTIDNIWAVWREITYLNEHFTYKTEAMTEICAEMYGRDVITRLMSRMNADKEKLIKERFEHLKSSGVGESDAASQAQWEWKCIEAQTLCTLVEDGIKNREMYERLDSEKVHYAHGIVSKRPRIIFILDDVTSELATSSNAASARFGEKEKVLMQKFVTDFLTRARHLNMIGCLFIHDISIVANKNMINNFIILDQSSAGKIANCRSIDERIRNVIRLCFMEVAKYKWHFLYVDPDVSKTYVGCAQTHIMEKLTISPMNQKCADLIKEVNGGLNSVSTPDDESSDETSDDEPVTVNVNANTTVNTPAKTDTDKDDDEYEYEEDSDDDIYN